MRDRYSIAVGLIFFAVVVIAILTGPAAATGRSASTASRAHWPLPEFAVPLATSSLEGDANVAQDDCETSQLPVRRPPHAGLPGARCGARSRSAISSTGRR